MSFHRVSPGNRIRSPAIYSSMIKTIRSIAKARRYSNVTVIKNNVELGRKWRKTVAYSDELTRLFINREVRVRQALNVEVAIELALKKGIDWLLHIDVDELFYSPTTPVKEHFRLLADKGISRISYLNYEAIPESPDIRDPFKEVTLFKRNQLALPNARISAEQQYLIDLCPHLPNPRFFFFYGNGKSAARLVKGLLPTGPHGFTVPADRGLSARLHRKIFKSKLTALAAKVMPNTIKKLSNALYPCRRTVSKDPIILHYACCGFEQFWLKYTTRGHFADTWLGKTDIAKCIGMFHLESRDVVMQGSRSLAREFYERRFVMSDKEEVRRLTDAGLICRIDGVAHQLKKIESERDSQQFTTWQMVPGPYVMATARRAFDRLKSQ